MIGWVVKSDVVLHGGTSGDVGGDARVDEMIGDAGARG
jgi:hypothetical protein